MNADSYVSLASNWTNVGVQLMEELESDQHYLNIDSQLTTIKISYLGDKIKFLEHVEVILDLDTIERGKMTFYLTSPQKTRVQLLGNRPRDNSSKGFKDWSLMSMATWSEDPQGEWELEIQHVRIFHDNSNLK